MKKYILILTLFIFLIGFTGCYTVIWTPDKDFPTASVKQQQELYYDSYYPDHYYGGYYSYYSYPWWYRITPPAVYQPEDKGERTESTGSLRNSGEGRGTVGGGSGGGRVISTPPVSIPGGSASDNTKPSTGTRETESTSTTSDRSKSSEGNNVRNNDGSRNSGERKK
jgi:hypothetical protein